MTSKKAVALLGALTLAGAALAALQPPATPRTDTPTQQLPPPPPPPPGPTGATGNSDLAITGKVVLPQVIPPGAEHEQINKLAGDWDCLTRMEQKSLPGQPPQPPLDTPSTATFKSVLEGRFIHESATQQGPDNVQLFKMWGYNTGSKKYEGVWSWTVSTGMAYLSGTSTDGGKTIEWNAWYEDDHFGKRRDFKVKTEMPNDDRFVLTIFGGKTEQGGEGPTITSTYTRKKTATMPPASPGQDQPPPAPAPSDKPH